MNFTTFNAWIDLPVSSDELFDQAARTSMFLSRQWFETLTATGLEDEKLILACVVEGDQLLALLPLLETGEASYGYCTHRYSAFSSLLLTEQDRPAVVDCLADGLKELPVDSLQIKSVAADDPELALLIDAMSVRHYDCQRRFQFYNWIQPVDGQSFDEYMAERPSKLRNTIERKGRKLEREHGYHISMYTGADVQRGLVDYHAIYSSSWKASEQYRAVLDASAIKLSIPDWTRLAVLYAGDGPIAAQLWFVVHGHASIFRLAYDESFKSYSPGSILTSYLMRYVIDTDRVSEIDFLTGDEAYKSDWMSIRRQRDTITLFKERGNMDQQASIMGRLSRFFGGAST